MIYKLNLFVGYSRTGTFLCKDIHLSYVSLLVIKVKYSAFAISTRNDRRSMLPYWHRSMVPEEV